MLRSGDAQGTNAGDVCAVCASNGTPPHRRGIPYGKNVTMGCDRLHNRHKGQMLSVLIVIVAIGALAISCC